MRGFTQGSSSGWTGDILAGSAAIRILDVTLEDDESRRVTIVIAPSIGENADHVSPVLDAEAIVEWGATDGTSQRAEVDVGAGAAFAVTGTRLIVSLRSIGVTPAHPRKSRYRATASLGEGGGKFAPLRVVRFGPLDAGATTETRVIPAFARRLFFVRAPQGAVDVRYVDGLNTELEIARSADAEEPALIVAPGARGFSVTNIGAQPLRNIRAVFELNFEG
jgi:hypothetical protein